MPQHWQNEFLLSHLSFKNYSPTCFNVSQWGIPRPIYLSYRILVFLYWLGFFVASLVASVQQQFISTFFIYLSNWGQTLILLYLFFALYTTLSGNSTRDRRTSTKLFYVANSEIRAISNENQAVTPDEDIRWYHRATGVLFLVASNIAFAVTCMYPLEDKSYANGSILNINLHIMNTVVILLDCVMNSIPVHMIQFLFTAVVSGMYGITLFVLHLSGVNSTVYEVIDWENSPIQAIIITIFLIVIAPMLTHLVVYGITLLKYCLANRLSTRI